ncbi:MAG TPA: efflux RND transporter periplasmic adaptor subunit [Candidatus Caenarcaniphilales bacterium]
MAHGGHGNEFQGGHKATRTQQGAIKVDAETAKRLGIKVEPVTRKQLTTRLKTTGQIEPLPNQQVEVTTPVPGTLVKLLAAPGKFVSAGQALAVLSSPELAELRVSSLEKGAEAEADVQEAQADLRLAQQNYERQRQLAAADLRQARTQSALAQERYGKDRQLAAAGALPRRQAFESRAQLAEAKAVEARVASQGDVLEAAAQLKRAQSALGVAQSRTRLNSAAYEARLEQLGARANPDGTLTIKAPISGKVAEREATPGESFEEAGEPLMTILNDKAVLATANIYEKDLARVKVDQRVQVKVASLPSRTFEGRIIFIGAAVEGETRVVPVKAQLDNSRGQLKPGLFAELEVLTAQTSSVLTVSSSAVVDANGKPTVFVQNGDAYQPVEVTPGQTSEGFIEIKRGLFPGDLVVTQRAPQLYAQSLRGGSATEAEEAEASEATSAKTKGVQLPWWLTLFVGGAIAAGGFWAGRRTQRRQGFATVQLDRSVSDAERYGETATKRPPLPERVGKGSRVSEAESKPPHQG